MKFLTTPLGRCMLFKSMVVFAYYQLISEPPIQTFLKGKDLCDISVSCNRMKLTFTVMQCGYCF